MSRRRPQTRKPARRTGPDTSVETFEASSVMQVGWVAPDEGQHSDAVQISPSIAINAANQIGGIFAPLVDIPSVTAHEAIQEKCDWSSSMAASPMRFLTPIRVGKTLGNSPPAAGKAGPPLNSP